MVHLYIIMVALTDTSMCFSQINFITLLTGFKQDLKKGCFDFWMTTQPILTAIWHLNKHLICFYFEQPNNRYDNDGFLLSWAPLVIVTANPL